MQATILLVSLVLLVTFIKLHRNARAMAAFGVYGLLGSGLLGADVPYIPAEYHAVLIKMSWVAFIFAIAGWAFLFRNTGRKRKHAQNVACEAPTISDP